MSSLGRMFAYAKADASKRLEDYTTESLALAIKTDPTPVLEVLVSHDAVEPGPVTRVTPTTQFAIEGGRVDLVLQIDTDGRTTQEVWFENKVRAPEGPGQLALYRREIDAREKRMGSSAISSCWHPAASVQSATTCSLRGRNSLTPRPRARRCSGSTS